MTLCNLHCMVFIFFISNAVIPRGCQSRAVALALCMTQSEMKKQLFPREPIVSNDNLLKYTQYAQRLCDFLWGF